MKFMLASFALLATTSLSHAQDSGDDDQVPYGLTEGSIPLPYESGAIVKCYIGPAGPVFPLEAGRVQVCRLVEPRTLDLGNGLVATASELGIVLTEEGVHVTLLKFNTSGDFQSAQFDGAYPVNSASWTEGQPTLSLDLKGAKRFISYGVTYRLQPPKLEVRRDGSVAAATVVAPDGLNVDEVNFGENGKLVERKRISSTALPAPRSVLKALGLNPGPGAL